jgi:chemotaxis protein histidine kinase CheA
VTEVGIGTTFSIRLPISSSIVMPIQNAVPTQAPIPVSG